MLPKVAIPEQATALAELLSMIESRHKLPHGAIGIELMFETPQMVVDREGRCAVPKLMDASGGRCRGIHFGPYDYTASLGITSADASVAHPACDFARRLLQAATAGRGIAISDGPTALMPIPPHRPRAGELLSAEQREFNANAVRAAMRLHFENVSRALRDGIYQGWDLHPGQLPTRYAAVYAFFLATANSAAIRLRAFVDQAMRRLALGQCF